MDLAALVDELADGPLVVYGSLPPHGRDLDVAARTQAEADRLIDALVAQGLVRRGRELAWFGDCTAAGADVDTVERWVADDAEREAFFADSQPLPGYRHLRRPAPHHVLLLLARRAAYGVEMTGSKRERIEAADAAAWDAAERLAPTWGVVTALSYLRGEADRTRALVDVYRGKGASPARAWAHALRMRVRRPQGAVIALSGLDGAGKSTQAEALQQALDRLGVDAAIEWTKIARNPSLDKVSAPVKRLLRRRAGPSSGGVDPVKSLRQQSAVLTVGWATYVALANAMWQRRATRPHLRAGRVVICDRYVLDTAAHLRHRYGLDRRFTLQAALVRLLSPKPLRAYLLDVEPETALSRKAEQYNLTQLTTLADCYRQAQVRLGVVRLDGQLPTDELCGLIARDVWLALSGGPPPS